MVRILDKQMIINNIDSVAHHAYQVVSTVTIETIKIIAASVLLKIIEKKYLSDINSGVPNKEIFKTMIDAPIVEEIIFRGILLQGIHLIQCGHNYIWDHDLTDEERKAQQVFRIHLSAFIFATAHLLNPHTNVA